MGFIYSAVWDNKAVTAAIDLFEITTVGTRPILIHQLDVYQTTDLGDAAEEVLKIGLYRGSTAGSGGTAITEVKYQDGSDEPTNDTAVVEYATGGTSSTSGTLIHVLGWNVRIPTQFIWTPELRPRCDSNDDPFSIRFIAAPADSITMGATLIWEEM
jgi:hypothetical protein